MKQKKEIATDKLSFEQALAGLEEVVQQLEQGTLGLTESLQQYQTGVSLLKQCHATLQEAERRIEVLTGLDEDGNAQTEPFSDDEMTLEEKQTTRSKRRSAKGDVDDSGDLF